MQIVHAAVQVSHEYVGHNDSTNEVKIVQTYLTQDHHYGTVNLPSPQSFMWLSFLEEQRRRSSLESWLSLFTSEEVDHS